MLILDMPALNLRIGNHSSKRFSFPLITFTGFVVALEICIYLVATELSKFYSASTETTYIVERFEDNGWVVLERDAKTTFDFPEVSVPINTREGDVLVFKKLKDGTLLVYRDEKETARQHRENLVLREGILPGPEGDIDL